MCFQEFIGYTCGHCSLAVLRPCPLTTAGTVHPVCQQLASKPFLTDEMCPACQRILHTRATLIEEYEHRFMHERGVCGCPVNFPHLIRPRLVGSTTAAATGHDNNTGQEDNGQEKQETVNPAVVPPLVEESTDDDGRLQQISVRLPSLFAYEWVQDHRARHEAGQCACPADFRTYPEVIEANRHSTTGSGGGAAGRGAGRGGTCDDDGGSTVRDGGDGGGGNSTTGRDRAAAGGGTTGRDGGAAGRDGRHPEQDKDGKAKEMGTENSSKSPTPPSSNIRKTPSSPREHSARCDPPPIADGTNYRKDASNTAAQARGGGAGGDTQGSNWPLPHSHYQHQQPVYYNTGGNPNPYYPPIYDPSFETPLGPGHPSGHPSGYTGSSNNFRPPQPARYTGSLFHQQSIPPYFTTTGQFLTPPTGYHSNSSYGQASAGGGPLVDIQTFNYQPVGLPIAGFPIGAGPETASHAGPWERCPLNGPK